MAKGTWIALGVLAGIVLVVVGILGSGVGVYNELVDEQTAVDAQAKQVDVQYQRAFRLLPTLMNLTEQYMQNEREVLTNVTALRSGLSAAQNGTFEAKDAYLQDMVAFVALVGNRVENYPDLEANELFKSTMAEIVNTENKIAAEKVLYNDRVQDFNAHVRKCCMPLLVANMLGFDEKEFIGFQDRPNQTAFPEGQQI